MMELRYETLEWTPAELLWNCPATHTFHKLTNDAILASCLDLFLKRMGYENPGCTGRGRWSVGILYCVEEDATSAAFGGVAVQFTVNPSLLAS